MKRLYALLLLGFAQLGLAQSGHAADARLDAIETLRLAGDYPAAIELALTEIAADADNGLLLNQLGELRLEVGELDAAAARFQQALEQPGPARLMAKLNLAELHYQRGEWQSAETLWREIREAWDTASSLSAADLFAIAQATRRLREHTGVDQIGRVYHVKHLAAFLLELVQ